MLQPFGWGDDVCLQGVIEHDLANCIHIPEDNLEILSSLVTDNKTYVTEDDGEMCHVTIRKGDDTWLTCECDPPESGKKPRPRTAPFAS